MVMKLFTNQSAFYVDLALIVFRINSCCYLSQFPHHNWVSFVNYKRMQVCRKYFFQMRIFKNFGQLFFEVILYFGMCLFNFGHNIHSIVEHVNDVLKIVTGAVIVASAVKCFEFGSQVGRSRQYLNFFISSFHRP